jgi:ADP-ribose pyrophosphatase
MSETNPPLALPKLLEHTVVFQDSLIQIARDRLQVQEQPPYTYYSLVTPPYAVVILALTDEGAYVLTEEYRHPTGQILLGCPGGFMNPDEDPLEAAQREFLEETGFNARNFQIIGSAYPYAGFSGQKTYYVQAQGATLSTQPRLEASEIIQPRLLQPTALDEAIRAGVALDGTLGTALFFYKRYLTDF